jgi:hypothetical protein
MNLYFQSNALLGSVQDYDDCEELQNGNNGFERKTTLSDFSPNKAAGIMNMIKQIQKEAGNGAAELPDYESSLQNLMRLDETLQQLDGLLGKGVGPKYRDRFKKKRLIKQNDDNATNTNSTIRAI